MPSGGLEVRNLSKAFAGTRALDGLDFSVEAGEVRALLGENGSGKSTLIKILAGFHHPSGGSVLVGGVPLAFGSAAASHGLGLRFVHQNLALVDQLSVEDNLALSTGYPVLSGVIRVRASRASAVEALRRVGLEIDPGSLVGKLTPAEKTGVAVARALRGVREDEATVLVLDEPTATLPDVEVARILQIVRTVQAMGVAVVYVTHRLEEVFQVASTVTVLQDGRHVATVPVGTLSREELVHLMVGEELDEVHRAASSIHRLEGAPALEVSGLHTARLHGVSVNVSSGEIVGVAGITGSGREELLGCIFGVHEVAEGRVVVSGTEVRGNSPRTSIGHGVAFVPAERQRLGTLASLSARENISITNDRLMSRPLLDRRYERRSTAEWFRRLKVRPQGEVERPLGLFSGGNQQKVVFGKWLQRTPRVLLLDEPTQGVDVATKALLHRNLLNAAADGAAILVSSSDSDELAALCHRVLILHDGRVVEVLEGDDVTPTAISQRLLHAPHDGRAVLR